MSATNVLRKSRNFDVLNLWACSYRGRPFCYYRKDQEMAKYFVNPDRNILVNSRIKLMKSMVLSEEQWAVIPKRNQRDLTKRLLVIKSEDGSLPAFFFRKEEEKAQEYAFDPTKEPPKFLGPVPIKHVGKWNANPAHLLGTPVEELNKLIIERESALRDTWEFNEDREKAVAFLTKDYTSPEEHKAVKLARKGK